MRINSILICLFCACLGCARSAETNSGKARKGNWTPDELARLIVTVPPWSSESQYHSNDWVTIAQVATVFQHVNATMAAEAFHLFSVRNTNDFHGDYLESSKALLLLRVMFDLPEHGHAKPGGPGWLTLRRDLNPDGTVNLGWPITWGAGAPSLASPYLGYDGFPYNPESDYLFLSSHYKERDLTGVLRNAALRNGH